MTPLHKGRHDSPPRVTFYLTLVFELTGATEQYTYSIEYVTPSVIPTYE